MAKKEKFGKFVLLDEIENSGLGAEYRAAKLSQTGLEKIVSVLRLSQSISGNGDVAKSLMDQAKVAAQLQNPNIVKIYGIGKVDAAYYISYEFIEGKSLKAIFNRCRHEGFPFSVDHSLLIASKICSALEYAHGRKSEGGGRYFHGLLTPACVVVSYEGEVRVRGFGYWPGRVRDAGLASEESLYLAPEQAAGQAGDTRSDIFAVCAIMYETLTGHALFESGRTQDVAGRLAHAKLQSPSSDDDALPKPIADILGRALAVDPAGRFGEVQEMRKAIDTLLFSGDFTPTTFNLAFFMHSLFREDIERESKALKEEKEASYLEFLTDEPVKAPGPAPAAPAPPPVPAARPTATVVTSTSALPLIPPPPKGEPIRPSAAHREEHAPGHHEPPPREVPHHHAPGASAAHADAAGLSPKEAAAGFTFHKDEPKSKAPLFGGIAALVLIGGGAAYFVLGRTSGPATPPATAPLVTTLSAEALRVKQLEQQLEELKKQQEEVAEKARQEAAAKLQKEAKAKGTEVDAAALQKAQEDAARKARAEEEKRAKEEKGRLEAEKAEAERMAAERVAAEKAAADKAAAEEAARQAAAATLPPSTLPALRPGALVNITDAGVIAPVVERTPALQYPPIALRQRVEGTVELNILVDEKGNVADAQVVSGAGGKSGLNEGAIENVKRRKYRPATKEGIPVKVWVSVRVKFELPR